MKFFFISSHTKTAIIAFYLIFAQIIALMKRLFLLCFLLLSASFFGQGNQPWRSFFSYNNIVDITQSGSAVYGAASSAMFSKNVLTEELKTITSVDGLKAESITAVHHSTAYNRTLVGNSNGLLLVINADNTIATKIDIVQEATVAPSKKKINHIYEHEGKAYISCDFGIAVFNIATMEFGDTYYLGPNGAEVAVAQCTVLNSNIFAVIPGAIFAGQLGNPNLNDYGQWTGYVGGNWTGIVTHDNSLFVCDAAGGLYRIQNDNPVFFASLPSAIVDLKEANGYMTATCANRVNVYTGPVQAFQINVVPDPVTFTCATVLNEKLFIGTQERGIYSTPLNSLSFENITPDGPVKSNIFRITKSPNFLWAVYGDYTNIYNPYPLDYYGVSKLTPTGWFTIPNQDLFNAASISDIVVSPTNENLVYAASFHNGLIKIESDVPVANYDNSPSIPNGPETLNDPTFPSVRINSLAFDKTGNLWMTNSRIEKAIKELKINNGWASYSVDGVVSDPEGNDYGKMVIDKNGTKWIPSRLDGIVAFNESPLKYIVIGEGQNGNLPSKNSKCVAIDANNRLWIGTDKGLRVVPGVDRFMTEDQLTANPIIILEDGLAQELMFEQGITDIVVDGSNNKWIGTANAGAFLVSPDGQSTLFHFTKENSPLPSNTINDIEIDNVTGEVFFATDRGMVSYAGTSTAAEDDLSQVYVFPNPVRPGFQGDVNISGLIDDANIKITDIEGNLVYETTSEGGTILWDTTAFGKYKVASGVYMIFISSEDGTMTKVKKVMIIR
jgi:hypothetical protein